MEMIRDNKFMAVGKKGKEVIVVINDIAYRLVSFAKITNKNDKALLKGLYDLKEVKK